MARGERKIAHLIDDLLDLGRIRSGQMELDLSSFDLCDVIRDVGALMEAQTVDTGSTLNMELNEPVVGRWDRARLDQVVSNLLANAVKYGEGRPVVIRAGADPQRSLGWLAVTDQGLGIEPGLPGDDLRTVQARDDGRSARRSRPRPLHRARDRRAAGRRCPRGQPPRLRRDVPGGAPAPVRSLTPFLLSGDGKAVPQGVCSGNR